MRPSLAYDDPTLAPALYKAKMAVEAAAIQYHNTSLTGKQYSNEQVFLQKLRECMIDGCTDRQVINRLDEDLAPFLQYAEQAGEAAGHKVITGSSSRKDAHAKLLTKLKAVYFPWVYQVPGFGIGWHNADSIAAVRPAGPLSGTISYAHITDAALCEINEGRLEEVYAYPGLVSHLRDDAWVLLPPTYRGRPELQQPQLSLQPVSPAATAAAGAAQVAAAVAVPSPAAAAAAAADVAADAGAATSSAADALRQLNVSKEQLAEWACAAGQLLNARGCVYEMVRRQVEVVGEPTFDVVLFHGLQPGDYKQAYLETWQYKEGGKVVCSLPACFAAALPQARVLSVSYDSSAMLLPMLSLCGPSRGELGWQQTRELLAVQLHHAGIGSRPFVFVGHSLGGLIMQQVLLEFHNKAACNYAGYDRIIPNIKGMVYYGTPHLGSELANLAKKLAGWVPRWLLRRGRMMDYLTTLSIDAEEGMQPYQELKNNTGQLGSFTTLALYETLTLPVLGKRVVEKGSARSGMKFSHPISANHMDVCTPSDVTDFIFVHLYDYLVKIACVA